MPCASTGVIPMHRATSLTTLLLLSSANVAIWPTLSCPYLFWTYAMTSSRRSMQKSTSKSGMLMRSGLRKRSNSRLCGIGSRSVIRMA